MTSAQNLVAAPPTTDIDIALGAVTYHTTTNAVVDLFLNLLPALTDGDLERLDALGFQAQQELVSRTTEHIRAEFGDADLNELPP